MGRDVSASARMQLMSAGTSTLWQDVGGILVAVGAIGVSGRLVIVETGGAGTFQAAVGVQTFGTDLEVAASPVQPSVNVTGTTGLGMKSGISKTFFAFDPTNASNGDLTKFFRFRVGLLFNTTTAVISRAEVLFEYTVRYA